MKDLLFWTGTLGGQPHTHTQTHACVHTHDEHRAGQLALGFPITRSRACSCSSCCCKISNCLCSSSNCRLMYSWRGRQQSIQRNAKRERERKRTGNFKGDKSCQVKCRRKEGKKIPRHLLKNRRSMPHRSKSISMQSKAQARHLQQLTEMAQCFAATIGF